MANGFLKILAGLFGTKPATALTDRPIAGVIIGIGNDNDQYRGTRHNIGFDVADLLLDRYSATEPIVARHSRAAVCRIDEHTELIIAKPTTYVNRSGSAVNELLSMSALAPKSCLVVVDDINLPLGAIRSRGKGSDGGHNGLKSIIREFGRDFPRVRIGIGPVPQGTPLVEFVLGQFAPEEQSLKKRVTELAAEAVVCWGQKGMEPTMSRYNTTVEAAEVDDKSAGV